MSMFRRFLVGSCLVAAMACDAEVERVPEVAESTVSSGRVGFHGMVLFGDRDRAYLSHIATFDDPHDVQAIIKIQLSNLPGNAPATFSDRLYTFPPG